MTQTPAPTCPHQSQLPAHLHNRICPVRGRLVRALLCRPRRYCRQQRSGTLTGATFDTRGVRQTAGGYHRGQSGNTDSTCTGSTAPDSPHSRAWLAEERKSARLCSVRHTTSETDRRGDGIDLTSPKDEKRESVRLLRHRRLPALRNVR